MIRATTLTVGHAAAVPLILTDPLSFWGGVDDDGTIVDRGHAQYGECVAGRVLVLPAGKGSSSSSSVLAELIRNGSGPAGIVLGETDAIIALGALVAEELYDIQTPVVVAEGFATIPPDGLVSIDAWPDRAEIDWPATGASRCPPTLWLDAHAVGEIFTRDLALQSQRTAFAALGAGTAVMPGKLVTPSPSGQSMALTYTAQLSAESGPVTKFTAVHPRNPERGLPTISATVIALDAASGCVSAVLDGTTITTRRTAAATALAVSLLAVEGSVTLTVFGYGVQAREHVLAVAAVRPLAAVHVAGRNAEKARSLELELNRDLSIAAGPQLDAETAVRASNLVILCTTSLLPVIEAGWIEPGSLVVSVGSFEPHRHEVGTDTIARADVVVVDDPETAALHAGPIIAALQSGELDRSALVSLGECVVGSVVARTSAEQIIFYNTTGLGVQDAAAAWAIIAVAGSRGVGRTL